MPDQSSREPATRSPPWQRKLWLFAGLSILLGLGLGISGGNMIWVGAGVPVFLPYLMMVAGLVSVVTGALLLVTGAKARRLMETSSDVSVTRGEKRTKGRKRSRWTKGKKEKKQARRRRR